MNHSGWSLYHSYACHDSPYWKSKGGNFTPISTNANSTNLTDSLYALPSAEDAEAFYTEVFSQGLAQGMIGTELDYEFVDYEKFHILRYEVGYAERWLQGLSNAAVKLNVPVQFCMSYPRYILETLRLPAVTNARASDDFNVDGPAYEYPVRKNGSAFLNVSPEPVLANHHC